VFVTLPMICLSHNLIGIARKKRIKAPNKVRFHVLFRWGQGLFVLCSVYPTAPRPPKPHRQGAAPPIHTILHIISPHFKKPCHLAHPRDSKPQIDPPPPYFSSHRFPGTRYLQTPRRWYLDVFDPPGVLFLNGVGSFGTAPWLACKAHLFSRRCVVLCAAAPVTLGVRGFFFYRCCAMRTTHAVQRHRKA
jgi:hypothetical protein